MSASADRTRLGDIQDMFAFAPDTARAALVDSNVRSGLADSLETLRDTFSDLVGRQQPALRKLSEAVRAGPTRPQVFALYTEAVHAIHANDGERAARLFGLLASPELSGPAPERVVSLSDEHLGDGMASRYQRIVNDGGSSPLALQPPSHDALTQARTIVQAALQLLRAGAPGFAGEIDALARQIVLARPQSGSSAFGGVSTFYLWGAVLLNAEEYSDRVAMAEALVHESTHLLLFGICGGEPLVENPDTERYRSPLRADPRPMEGIVHATYVTARIAAAMQSLGGYGGLSEAERSAVERYRRHYAELYFDTLDTIRRHARFTPAGEQVFADCVETFRA